MNKFILWAMFSALMLVGFGMIQYPDQNFHVVVCDVGQGDSILIYRRFSQILIDGGANDLVSDCLAENVPWFDNKIELVILTHPQEDHMRGLIEVVENYEVGWFLTSGGINDTNTFWKLRENMVSKGVESKLVSMGDKFRVGEIDLEVKWPEKLKISEAVWGQISSREELKEYARIDDKVVLGATSDDPNSDSVVLEVKYGEVIMLSTGDIGVKQEQALLRLGVITPVNVLKVAHHGSNYSSSKDFLEETRPKWALMSVGENNRFGHPSRDVLMYLDMVGAKILRTDENGTLELVSDGKKIWEKKG
jgi:competence protein ComEC